jgi:hypothetical protein
MYGTDTGIAGGALATTGLALGTGSFFLGAVGLVLAGVALYLLFRKEGKVKP